MLRAEVRTGDTTQVDARGDDQAPAELPGARDSRVPLPARDRAAEPGGAHHGNDPSSSTRSTRSLRDKRGSHLAVDARTPRAAMREAAGAHRSVGDAADPSRPSRDCLVGRRVVAQQSDGSPRCAVVDVGHRRALDVAIELPSGELEAVASREQLGEVLDAIAAHVRAHKTTLVFVNTRRMAERVAHLLADVSAMTGRGPPWEPLEGSTPACRIPAPCR